MFSPDNDQFSNIYLEAHTSMVPSSIIKCTEMVYNLFYKTLENIQKDKNNSQ